MKILKIILAAFLLLLAAGGSYIYLNRQALIDNNIDGIIKRLMPSFMEAGDMSFDLKNRKITIRDLKVLNPAGCANPYLLDVPKIECVYEQLYDQNILKGIKIRDIEMTSPVIYIERLRDSSINVQNVGKTFAMPAPKQKTGIGAKILGFFAYLFSPVKNISELLKLEPVLKIKGGKFIFDDFYVNKPYTYTTTIERVSASVKLELSAGFKSVDYIESDGTGLVNGGMAQALDWKIAYDPLAPKLTMSNNFNVRNVDFTHFNPYYDRFSPFIFNSGRMSGELIFNFDNSEIGSVNEIRFSQLDVEAKKDSGYAKFWPVDMEDLYKYFSSSSGEVVFDFKIKGTIEEPKFYLGPKTKRAVAKMVVNKLADAILKKDENPDAQSPGQPEEEKSDIEKVVDIFKRFTKSDSE